MDPHAGVEPGLGEDIVDAEAEPERRAKELLRREMG